MRNCVFCFFLAVVSFSCSTRNLIYFSDLPPAAIHTEKAAGIADQVIRAADYISVRVSTLNPETNLLFNTGVIPSLGNNTTVSNSDFLSSDGYRVDKDGAINFPVLGKVVLGGLTIDEATEKLTGLLENEAKNPIVNIKLLNFKITVLGEVSSPGTFSVPSENINIVEAIGLAGDLTPYGKRENLLIVRVQDGVRTTARLNLNKKDIFSSPYFYLQQNDIIYVEPVRARAEQASLARSNISIALSMISILSFAIMQFL